MESLGSDLVVEGRMESLDEACRRLHDLCRELNIVEITVTVRGDGRVAVQSGAATWHADAAFPDDPLPSPSGALGRLAWSLRQ
jgi:hypothetical protein